MNPTSTESTDPAPTLNLRVVRGVHVGAQRESEPGAMLVVGSADDCDVILSDPGVEAHHAIVNAGAHGWSIRALDGAVTHGTRTFAAGEATSLDWFAVAGVGSAALAIGDANSERWASLGEYVPEPASSLAASNADAPRRRRYALAALAGIVVCLATAITAATMHPDESASVMSQRALLERSIQEVALEKSEIAQDGKGKLRVSGLAHDEARVDRLRDDLAARGVVADVDVRSGKEIARDVSEVLRLSDLRGDAEYRGNGEVAISGHFGDGKALDAVLASRALRDIKGLTKMAVTNLDKGTPVPAPVSGDAEARHIVVAVGGADPYVVTGDGSRYFAGALLPCGGRLRAVDGSQVFVDTAAGTGALDCTGAIVMTALADDAVGPRRDFESITPTNETTKPSPNG